jgi:hypothetical protein
MMPHIGVLISNGTGRIIRQTETMKFLLGTKHLSMPKKWIDKNNFFELKYESVPEKERFFMRW